MKNKKIICKNIDKKERKYYIKCIKSVNTLGMKRNEESRNKNVEKRKGGNR